MLSCILLQLCGKNSHFLSACTFFEYVGELPYFPTKQASPTPMHAIFINQSGRHFFPENFKKDSSGQYFTERKFLCDKRRAGKPMRYPAYTAPLSILAG
jgi:hypothetical protein